MERTISMMMGPGSINHNNRKFIADNVDRNRVKDNVVLVNQNLKKVYHELFDEALKKYNEKQKRKDRKIKDYYEHVRQDKQLKQFYEVIVQVGNKDDMACGTKEGDLAKYILEDYIEDFQARNPNLKVFNAVIHMDEATPHLHINFVPFSQGNKRGLETQVSLKGALKAQGIVGSGRSDTEWNRWIEKEKEACAISMGRYGVGWNHLGTHKEHLSVLEYKKQERKKEICELEKQKSIMEDDIYETEGRQYDADEKLYNTNEEIRKREQQKISLEKECEDLEQNKRKLRYDSYNLSADVEVLKDARQELKEEIQRLETDKNEKYIEYEIITQEADDARQRLQEYEKKTEIVTKAYEEIMEYCKQNKQVDKYVELSEKAWKLEEENKTLKWQLHQAYEFMKAKFLDGINMFEEFTRSIGAKVQERWEDRNRGAR